MGLNSGFKGLIVKPVSSTVSTKQEGSKQRIPKPTTSHVLQQTCNPSHDYPRQLRSRCYTLCRAGTYISGTLVPIYQTTWRYTPEDLQLNTEHPETLKPHPSPPRLLYLQGFPTNISVYVLCFSGRKLIPIALQRPRFYRPDKKSPV